MNLDFDLSGLGTGGSNPKKDDDNQNEEVTNLGDISLSPEEITETTSSSSFDFDIGSYNISSDTQPQQEAHASSDETIDEPVSVQEENVVAQEEIVESDISDSPIENTQEEEGSLNLGLQESETEQSQLEVQTLSEEDSQEQPITYNLGLDDDISEEQSQETVVLEDDTQQEAEAEDEVEDEPLNFTVSLTEDDTQASTEQSPTISISPDSVDETIIQQQEQSSIIGGLKLNMPVEETKVPEFENIEQGPELPPFVVSIESQDSVTENAQTQESSEEKKTKKKGLFGFFKKDKTESNKKDKKDSKKKDKKEIKDETPLTMEEKIADIQASIQQPEETEIVAPTLNIDEIPQAGVIPVEMPQATQLEETSVEEDVVSAPSRFSMDAQPKEQPKKEATFSASTIRLDLEEDKKEPEVTEQSNDIFKKKGALFPQSQKEDSEKPVINILSEIAKNGVNFDETIEQKVETEIFKTVQQKKKSKLMLKKVMTSVIGLVVVGGVGAGIYFGSNNNIFASILKSGDDAAQNTGTTAQTSDAKDKEIEALKAQLKNSGPKGTTGDDSKIKDLEAQIAQKDKDIENLKQNSVDEKTQEQMEKLKKTAETYNKTLSEKNKAIAALMTLKGVDQLSGTDILTKEELESVKLANLYDVYIQDYSLIGKSNLGENEKKTLLTQFNNNVFDLKDGKIDYKQFRLKYNAIVNKALESTK